MKNLYLIVLFFAIISVSTTKRRSIHLSSKRYVENGLHEAVDNTNNDDHDHHDNEVKIKLRGIFDSIGKSVKSGLSKAGNAIKKGSKKVFNNVKNDVKKAGNKIQKTFKNVKNGVHKAGNAIKKGSKKVFNNMKNDVKKAGNKIQKTFKNVKNGVHKAGNAIKKGSKKVFKNAKNFVNNAGNTVKNMINNAGKIGKKNKNSKLKFKKFKTITSPMNRKIITRTAKQYKRDALNENMCDDEKTHHPYEVLEDIDPQDYEEKKNEIANLFSHISEVFNVGSYKVGEFFQNDEDISRPEVEELVEIIIDQLDNIRERFGLRFEEMYQRFMKYYIFNYKECNPVTREEAMEDYCVQEAMSEIFDIFDQINFDDRECDLIASTDNFHINDFGHALASEFSCFSNSIADISDFVAKYDLPDNKEAIIVFMASVLTKSYIVGMELHQFQNRLEQLDQLILNNEDINGGNPLPQLISLDDNN
ncbi:hypothetical protein A3Q56_00836 [Intoshia linei]|uniref:Uncharacterized protein n=1 Tax=Intoshia linei TaxID=1819745 RepID=A0A177BCY5_9BILA|nr:hypothetical protein A3Q56_00836 [Intoshia linei]